ncbi:DUF4124 domain-containing protein [Sulfuricystis multivorans]|uniref:DUF4124 domain-containing protein n=1 Tax=Sulfuricystis multivorans TaxID=2211108 RepID=UPI000F8476AF|nr:DUF4124 domain-containing protein [Sulfuricystis multivorans]
MRSFSFLRHPYAILLALLPLAAAAQVYSWKDASGKVHYGDRPPAERQAQVRQLPGAPAATPDVEAARKAAAERQFAQREKQTRSQDKSAPEDPAQAKLRAENCQRAKNQLAALESGQIRFTIDAKGERVALEGPLREEELVRARQSVAEWCK